MCCNTSSHARIDSMPSIKSILVGALLTSLASTKWIAPGGRWRDTDGNYINAHAGSVTWDQVTGKYFWFGEYKTEEQEEGGGVRVYSSDDLGTWQFHGLALGMNVRFITALNTN
jgi:hypothetical protein